MRPIDADELEKSLENYSNSHGLINAFVEFLNVVDEMPTLDVKPVVQGHWIEIKNKRGTVVALRCNVCGCSPKHTIRSRCCPNCGAVIESENKE